MKSWRLTRNPVAYVGSVRVSVPNVIVRDWVRERLESQRGLSAVHPNLFIHVCIKGTDKLLSVASLIILRKQCT